MGTDHLIQNRQRRLSRRESIPLAFAPKIRYVLHKTKDLNSTHGERERETDAEKERECLCVFCSSPAESAVYIGPDYEESRQGILEFNIAI